MITPVDGLVIESEEVALGDGLSLVRGARLEDAPGELRSDPYATVAVLRLEGGPGEGPGLEHAGRRLRRLQTALRLWDDAEPSLGPVAWARTDDGPWLSVPLATGLRRAEEDCLLPADEEDPLRAFCALVTRRTPRSGELAWALRRFELGCERGSALESLTDWLQAGRALLAEPSLPGYERLAERLAAICATPDEHDALVDRLGRAVSLERGVIAGVVRAEPPVEAIVDELGGCLRAVLRDVLCGHLDPGPAPARRRGARGERAASARRAGVEVLPHAREPVDVVDVVVELGHDDRRRVAERAAQVGDALRVARRQRGDLARRGADARGELVAELLGQLGEVAVDRRRLVHAVDHASPPNGIRAAASLRWK